MKTNKAKRYYVWFCESRNKGLSCKDFEQDIYSENTSCRFAVNTKLGVICFLKQIIKNEVDNF
jgi:hypothetical protein